MGFGLPIDGGSSGGPTSANDVIETTEKQFISSAKKLQIDTNTTQITSLKANEGLVKLDTSDSLGTLSTKFDSTIQLISDKLVAVALKDVNATTAEFNYLQGLTANIQSQINNLTNISSFETITETKAELDLVVADSGKFAIVRIDETVTDNPSTIYISNGTTWDYVGELKAEVRDFSTNPLDLAIETTGVLQESKIAISIARKSDLTPLSDNIDTLQGQVTELQADVLELQNGGGTGGGHIITNQGVSLPQQPRLEFQGFSLEDNPATQSTIVKLEAVAGGQMKVTQPTSEAISMTQNQVVNIEHLEATNAKLDIQVWEEEVGGLEVNSSKDMTGAVQEDSAVGTEIVDGRGKLKRDREGIAWVMLRNGTLSNGNLTANLQNDGFAYSSVVKNNKKRYAEVRVHNYVSTPDPMVLVYKPSTSQTWAYRSSGLKRSNVDSPYGAPYAQNAVIGILLDLDLGTISFTKNGVNQGVAFTGLSGDFEVRSYNANAGTYSATVNFGASPFQYPLPSGYVPFDDVLGYNQAQPYYIIATHNLATTKKINTATVTATEPTGTSLRYLVSFDSKPLSDVTKEWLYYNSTWQVAPNGLDDLQTLGMTTAQYQSALTNYVITDEKEMQTAIDLLTTDSTVTPSISQITLNIDEKDYYEKCMTGRFNSAVAEYGVRNVSANLSTVKKLTAGTKDVIINVITDVEEVVVE